MTAGIKNKKQIELILASIFPDSWVMEFTFHPVRKWRFDYAVPSIKLAIEYHGHAGMVGKSKSGHSTISGLTADCEKLSHAQLHGWKWIALTAMHFSPRDRIRHKLSSPHDLITKFSLLQ